MLNKEGAEVDDVTVVRDNDHLYVVSESPVQVEPHGECCGSLFHMWLSRVGNRAA